MSSPDLSTKYDPDTLAAIYAAAQRAADAAPPLTEDERATLRTLWTVTPATTPTKRPRKRAA